MKKYVLTLFIVMLFGINAVYAKNSELELTGDSILTKTASSTDSSAQSLSISDDYLYAYVFMTDKETPIADAVNLDIYTRNSINENFSFSSRVSALSYPDGNEIKYVEHANGSVYYKKGNSEYLLVTTKIDGYDSEYLIKYLISDNHSQITFVEKYSFPFEVVGITYDKNNDNFYVASNSQVCKYDSNFQNSVVIRKKGIGSASPSGTVGYFHENQDITYYNNHLYYETIVTPSGVDKGREETGLDLSAYDTIITVINAETGDFVKYLVFNYSDVVNYIKSKGYHTNRDLKEIEEIVFINNEPYYLIQSGANLVLIKSKTITNGVDIFDYTKLYINYNLNGGKLNTTANQITSLNDEILISGINKVEAGSLGGKLSTPGLADYNNSEYINVTKEGYHVEETKEWIDSSNKVYNQAIQYKISDLADITDGDKTISLFVNFIPNKYVIIFDANGGSGSMPSQEVSYDSNIKLSKNLFTNTSKFKEWNTKSDGMGISYTDEQEIINLSITNGDEIKLYAIWEVNTSNLNDNVSSNPYTGSTGFIIITLLLIIAFCYIKKYYQVFY